MCLAVDQTREGLGRQGQRLQVAAKALDDRLALFAQHAAHGVHEVAPRLHVLQHVLEDGRGLGGQACDLVALESQDDFGTPPQCARSRAGRVDQRAIEVARQVRLWLTPVDFVEVGQGDEEPLKLALEGGELVLHVVGRPKVDGACQLIGKLQRLTTVTGAGIQQFRMSRSLGALAHDLANDLRAFFLDDEGAFGIAGQPARIASALESAGVTRHLRGRAAREVGKILSVLP